MQLLLNRARNYSGIFGLKLFTFHIRKMATLNRLPCSLSLTSNVADSSYDGLVLVTSSITKATGPLQFLQAPVDQLKQIDNSVGNSPCLVAVPDVSGKRLVFSPTGPINRDFDDVRRFGDAAKAGIQRALKAGMKSPLLITLPEEAYPDAQLVSLLGALQTLYVPIEVREGVPMKATKVDKLGVYAENSGDQDKMLNFAKAIEAGRGVYRDIGGSDPERMAAPKVAEYVQNLFGDSNIKVEIVNPDVKKYPLYSAVNRCADVVPRHQGRIIKLEYTGEGEVKDTLLLVGKGVTYDTGGADVKAGGVMAGMHRDKCGAAFVAGFFQTVSLLKPKNVKVIGTMAMVRNSIGAECYVADEIITSRAGVRVRVGNTDAEGRMAMADPLCEMKERALHEVNPHLYTIATLTGHAIVAMGPAYSIIMDNGPARAINHAQDVQKYGDMVGDPFEISTIRREDYTFTDGKSEYEDVLQCNNLPSSRTPRGHQFPAAFMIRASGLDKYGNDAETKLKYSHIDIAGSSGPFPGVPTGAPIPALITKYFYKS